MFKTLAIAFNTYKEARRNRILAIFIFFAVALMVVSGVAATLAIGEKEKIMRDLGLAGINLFGLLVALFVGIGLVYNEIDRKTIYTVISKPIGRANFVVGKYLGLLITIYVATLLMTAFFFFVLHFQYYNDDAMLIRWAREGRGYTEIGSAQVMEYYAIHGWRAACDAAATFFLPFMSAEQVDSANIVWRAGGYKWIAIHMERIADTTHLLMPAILLSCLELAIVTAFAVLFSVVSTPFLAFFFTFVMIVIGRLNIDIMRFADHLTRKTSFEELTIAGKIGYLFAHLASLVCPNLTVFNRRYQVIYENSLPLVGDLVEATLYGVVYSIIILCLAAFIFNRRSFK